jgi:hypothetical protein
MVLLLFLSDKAVAVHDVHHEQHLLI